MGVGGSRWERGLDLKLILEAIEIVKVIGNVA